MNVRLTHHEANLLLISCQLRIDALFHCSLSCQFGALAKGKYVDADLNSGDPVVAARTGRRAEVFFRKRSHAVQSSTSPLPPLSPALIAHLSRPQDQVESLRP